MHKIQSIILLAAVGTLAACNADEGVFLPDCIAYAGDSIELRDGRYEWDKFTDAVEVDDAGNVRDPFPDYPRAGTYEVDGARVILTGDDGAVQARMTLVELDGRPYLLTEKEFSAWQASREMPNCALVLGGHREN